MRCAFTPLAEADLEEIGDHIAKDTWLKLSHDSGADRPIRLERH